MRPVRTIVTRALVRVSRAACIVTPVTGGIADREQDGTVLCFCFLQGLRSPGVPVDRVRDMWEKIGRADKERGLRSHDRRPLQNHSS